MDKIKTSYSTSFCPAQLHSFVPNLLLLPGSTEGWGNGGLWSVRNSFSLLHLPSCISSAPARLLPQAVVPQDEPFQSSTCPLWAIHLAWLGSCRGCSVDACSGMDLSTGCRVIPAPLRSALWAAGKYLQCLSCQWCILSGVTCGRTDLKLLFWREGRWQY